MRVCPIPSCPHQGRPQGEASFVSSHNAKVSVCRDCRRAAIDDKCLRCGRDVDHQSPRWLCWHCRHVLSGTAGSYWLIVSTPDDDALWKGSYLDDQAFLQAIDDGYMADGMVVRHYVERVLEGTYVVRGRQLSEQSLFPVRG